MDVSEDEIRETAEHVQRAAEMPTAADMARASHYLRAAQLASAWLAALDPQQEKHATAYRGFLVGYLAAIKDRL